jgi:hypothetical protein
VFPHHIGLLLSSVSPSCWWNTKIPPNLIHNLDRTTRTLKELLSGTWTSRTTA